YTVEHDPEADRRKVEALNLHYETHNFAFSQNQPNYDIVDRLHEITIPVLITVGRHDWVTPLEESELLHEKISNSTLKIFENSGHGPQNEERELWLQTVREFLKEHGPR